MHTSPGPLLLNAVAGLIVGAIIVYGAPRLVAYRLEEPIGFPSAMVLLPLAGAYLSRWRIVHSLATEIVTAAVFAGFALHYGANVRLPLACVYASLLIAIAYIDLDHRLVLNRLSYPGVPVALAGSYFWPGLGLESGLIGAACGLLVFLVLQLLGRGALGTGDTKLAVLIGAMRGFPNVFDALLLGVLLGAVAAIFLLVVLRRGRKSSFAYAPYLAAGAIVSFFVISG